MSPELVGIEFLSLIWEHQLKHAPPGKYHVTLMKRTTEGKMVHKAMPTRVLSETVLLPMPTEGDLYWCPNLFSGPKRKKEFGVGGTVLYQDLDEVTPAECSLSPTYWWETSPGRYQGVWLLDQWLNPLELMRLNKALNREVKADKGTWNLTRLLRVPGSWSSKRSIRVGSARPFADFRRVQAN